MWSDVRSVAFLLILAYTLSLTDAQTQSGFALLDVRVQSTGFHRSGICANFQQFFIKSLPDSIDSAPTYQLKWWNDDPNNYDVCGNDSTSTLINDIIPMQYVGRTPKDVGRCKPRQNHTFYIEGQMDQLIKAKASAGLFLLDRGTTSEFHGHNYLYSRFFNPKITNDTPVFYMYKQQFEDLYRDSGVDSTTLTTYRFYRPADPFLDAGVFVLLLLATGCIVIGSLWYTVDLKRRFDIGELKLDSNGQLVEPIEDARTTQNHEVTGETIQSGGSSTQLNRDERTAEKQPSSLEACLSSGTCVHICYTVQGFTVIVIILLLSFFYRSIAVEFFNVFIIIGGALAMTACLKSVVRICISDPKLRTPAHLIRLNESEQTQQSCWIPSFLFRPIRPIAFLIFCASLAFAITWRLNSNHPLAFLMLDFMNVNICIYAIKASEVKSLRLITFFLIAMFVYDIVMVFGTRLLTTNGCSVMVQVVTGLDCRQVRRPDYSSDWVMMPPYLDRPQKIPILFYVPLLSNPVGHCFDTSIEGNEQHMMLGLGDVIAPGYLIAFAFYLDVRKRNRFYIYGFTTTVGYIFGMLSTFISLKLMNTAQPALIYLVPFTLIPLVLLCLCKRTLRQAWYGNIETPLNL
ncbi:hypothetical protein M3Y98_00849100 [Aphelenchoides besseyi]|nr:hypothetical protein M3Y98_00849100 [Aphelenchoides besseyi]KAI6195316.1 hypothetical protein M3Y96_01218000 [Aphelenchoides besseyi]